MLFLPNHDKLAAEAKEIVQHVVGTEGRCSIKAWRDVPVDRSVVGPMAKQTEPRIVQVRTACSGYSLHEKRSGVNPVLSAGPDRAPGGSDWG